MKQPPPLLTATAYARSRKFNDKTIRRLYLRAGLTGAQDPVKVDAILAAAKPAHYQKGLTTKGAAISFNEAERRYKLARAKQEELKLAELEGSLISLAKAERFLFDNNRRIRDNCQNIPSRSSGLLAGQTQEQCFAILTKEINQMLEDLATTMEGR